MSCSDLQILEEYARELGSKFPIPLKVKAFTISDGRFKVTVDPLDESLVNDDYYLFVILVSSTQEVEFYSGTQDKRLKTKWNLGDPSPNLEDVYGIIDCLCDNLEKWPSLQ